MRCVIQRVSSARVVIKDTVKSAINQGLLLLLGIEAADTQKDINWLVRKIVGLRVFNDADGIMNLSVRDIGGGVLLISQFTLLAGLKKGNRPSYHKAAGPDTAVPLYEAFIKSLEQALGRPIGTGSFGAYMRVELVNDGPVTIIADSREFVK